MGRHQTLAVMLFSIGVALFLGGCTEHADNPLGNRLKELTTDPDYRLVMDMYTPDDTSHQDNYYMITASTRGDSLVDSMPNPPMFHRLAFSHNGIFACFSGDMQRNSWVIEWPLFDTLAVLSRVIGNLAFSEDDQYLLVGLNLYTVPDITPVLTQSPIHMNSAFIPGRKMFCYNKWPVDSIFFVDYGSDPIQQFALPVKDASGEPMAVAAFCPSVSGDSLIMATENGVNGNTQRYIAVVATDDLSIHDLVPYDGAFFQYSTPVIHPDGEKVYFHYKGDVWDVFKPVDAEWTSGTVYEYDIVAKQLSVLVDEEDVGRFHPMQLAVTPGGEYLYILDELNKIVKVDLRDNSISEILTDLAGNSMAMAIHPLAIEE